MRVGREEERAPLTLSLMPQRRRVLAVRKSLQGHTVKTEGYFIHINVPASS